jgi:hypothetical protein
MKPLDFSGKVAVALELKASRPALINKPDGRGVQSG